MHNQLTELNGALGRVALRPVIIQVVLVRDLELGNLRAGIS